MGLHLFNIGGYVDLGLFKTKGAIWCLNSWNSTNSNSVDWAEQHYFAFAKKLKSTQNILILRTVFYD